MKKITIALAGNPNSGKSTLFNQLTGSRQHIGNYPGVTVEKKSGWFNWGQSQIEVIDLPGAYSLTASSPEEMIVQDSILDDPPDLIVNVLDASNLTRNLYLSVQLMELGIPLLLVLNMSDLARKKGVRFDLEKLSKLLGVPLVFTIGHRGEGLDNLKQQIILLSSAPPRVLKSWRQYFNSPMAQALQDLISILAPIERKIGKGNLEWKSLRLLEKDENFERKLRSLGEKGNIILQTAKNRIAELEKEVGETSELALASQRYGFITGACREAVRSTIEIRRTVTDRIDSVLLNRFIGLPIFLGLMYLVFKLTFAVGDPLMGGVEGFFALLAGWIQAWWPSGSAEVLKSFLLDGLIGGVGGVLVFLPNILLLFLAIAILEGTGYMARVAFLMDRLMHKIGLHGKSFIPLLIGFGCTVPAIMATRTLESRRDRLTTILIAPLMSCSARLPIYALIIPAFFPKSWQAPLLLALYLLGIFLAIIFARLLRRSLFKGEQVPFVMELPPYRIPTFRSVLLHMWERGSVYLRKAGTLILAVSIVLWVLTTFPRHQEALVNSAQNTVPALSYTIAGRLGRVMEPIIRPLGFDWKIGTALIGAFAAKEVFVAQLGIVHSVGEDDESGDGLRARLRENYTPLQGLCMMLFCLISAPCMATIAITKRETNSWKWALVQLGGLTVIAYLVTFLTYQVGVMLGY